MLLKLRNSVPILLVLTSIVCSAIEDMTAEKIQKLQDALVESSEYMKREAKNEDAIICLGATRAGKSTLINYLIGNKLKAKRRGRGQPITIRKVNQSSAGPKIGGGSTSKTTIPTRWISNKLENVAIWDSPGFSDNRGAVQDITNAFYIYQLIEKVKSLKVVLAIDVNDILSDNIKPFVSVLNSVENLFGNNTEALLPSLTVIFTKVPDTLVDVPVTVSYITEILKQQFLDSEMSLSENSKDIVKYLVDNRSQISLFKRAKEGIITSSIDVNIFNAIINSLPLGQDELQNTSPSISESSKLFLYKARDQLLTTDAFDTLENVVSSLVDKKVQDLESNTDQSNNEDNIRALLEQLKEIYEKLLNAYNQKSDYSSVIDVIQSIDTSIEEAIKQDNLLEKIQLIKFIDKLLGMEQNNQLALSLQKVVLSSSLKVKEAMGAAEVKLGDITQQKHNETMEEDRKKHQEDMDKVQNEMKNSKTHDSGISRVFERLLSAVTSIVEGLAETYFGNKLNKMNRNMGGNMGGYMGGNMGGNMEVNLEQS